MPAGRLITHKLRSTNHETDRECRDIDRLNLRLVRWCGKLYKDQFYTHAFIEWVIEHILGIRPTPDVGARDR